jgi:hypothetical protein
MTQKTLQAHWRRRRPFVKEKTQIEAICGNFPGRLLAVAKYRPLRIVTILGDA